MSIEVVREYLSQFGVEKRMLEFTVSSATVELAAKAVGVAPQRIAKSLSFMVDGNAIIVVVAGDVKIDNAKYKGVFHTKAKMLTYDEVLEFTGHPVGGVCPFALKDGVKVYLDVSLQRFATVFPAVGTPSSAIELNMDELFKCANAVEWVDVTKLIAEDVESF